MKHIIKFFIPFYISVIPVLSYADSVNAYNKCKSNINHKYAFDEPTDARYKAILNELNAAEQAKYENWLDSVVKKDSKGDCSGTGIPYTTYTCKAGQKNRDCVPQICWSVHNKSGSMLVEHKAKEKFIAEMVEKECGPKPAAETPAAPANNTPAKQAAPDKKSDHPEQKKSESKIDQKKQQKEAECAAKNPPQTVKKNFLGKWECTDSDETVAAREAKKKADATLKSFWDDMDDLDKAFTKRINKLRKSGSAK